MPGFLEKMIQEFQRTMAIENCFVQVQLNRTLQQHMLSDERERLPLVWHPGSDPLLLWWAQIKSPPATKNVVIWSRYTDDHVHMQLYATCVPNRTENILEHLHTGVNTVCIVVDIQHLSAMVWDMTWQQRFDWYDSIWLDPETGGTVLMDICNHMSSYVTEIPSSRFIPSAEEWSRLL